MKDVMIDLETLGTEPDAAFVAVGACEFDLETGEIGETLRRTVDTSSIPKDRRVDPSVVGWWLRQDRAVAERVFAGRDIYEVVLRDLLDFAADKRVWSKGATFDIIILEHAFRSLGCPSPWAFRDVRDVRTIYHLGEEMRLPAPPEPKIPHDPLSDAVAQARWVSAVWQAAVGGMR